jgi:hypothetical protein
MATPLPLSTAQHHVSLSNHDKQQLVDFVASHCSAPANLTDQQVLALAQRHPVALPSIQASLDALTSNQISSLLIDNLPVELLPAPPNNGVRPAGKGWLSESILLQVALACRLMPFAYAGERNGSPLIQEVVPSADRTNDLSSLGGSLALGFHTDKGALRSCFRPEFLCLIGLQNPSTPTLITDLLEALDTLRRQNPAMLEILGKPLFGLGGPACIREMDDRPSEPRPLVVKDHQGNFSFAGNLRTVRTADPLALQALAAFEIAVSDRSRPTLIAAGQCCLVSNFRALHGRGAIGGPRWLERVYLRNSLRDLREETGSPDDAVIFSLKELLTHSPPSG